MKYNIITTQPDIYQSFLQTGLIARGIDRKIIDVEIFNLHNFAFDKRKSVDDIPYGGGVGMVLKIDVMANAIDKIRSTVNGQRLTILLTPQGKKLDQKKVNELAKYEEIILISGRFEGYDERIRDLVDEEISVGDYVLTSGDLPAMVLIDSISRQIPGFIDREESIVSESFANNILEYPQYTRPEMFDGKKVPDILLSGNHAQIAAWRQAQSINKTKDKRPDLIDISP